MSPSSMSHNGRMPKQRTGIRRRSHSVGSVCSGGKTKTWKRRSKQLEMARRSLDQNTVLEHKRGPAKMWLFRPCLISFQNKITWAASHPVQLSCRIASWGFQSVESRGNCNLLACVEHYIQLKCRLITRLQEWSKKHEGVPLV